MLLSSELAGKREQLQQYQTKAEILETEKDLLEKALQEAEKAHGDLRNRTREMEEQLSVAMTTTQRSTEELEQLKGDVAQQEVKYDKLLLRFNKLHLEKKTVQEQAERRSSVTKTLEARLKESEVRATQISKEIEALEDQNRQLREEVSSLRARLEEQGQGAENLQKELDESCEGLQAELSRKDKHIKAMETKLSSLKTKLETKTKHQEESQKEIRQLKETAESLQKASRKKHQELLDEVAAKSSSETELQKEVQDLKLTAAEAVRSREDVEIKCQHKIADMVALMEKHKSQYDKMLEVKDVELKERKRSVAEADASRTALELKLEQSRTENDKLKNHLDQQTKEGKKLMQKIAELKEELVSVKTNPSSQLSKTPIKQLSEPAAASEERCSDTPAIKRNVLDFSKIKQKTPSQSAGKIQTSTPVVRETKSSVLQTPSSTRVGETPRIKSYRIRTPPSAQKAGLWSQTPLELDPRSDSSEHADLLSFAVVEPLQSSQQGPPSSARWSNLHVFKKNQSPAVQKSPGNTLKLAAMKRMRDAGWTAVMGSSKKKKAAEKIFA